MKTRKLALAATVAAAGLIFTGCSSGGSAEPIPSTPTGTAESVLPDPVEPTTEETSEPSPYETTNSRGNSTGVVGQKTGFYSSTDDLLVEFTVNKITLGSKKLCTEPSPEAPENGQFAILDVSVKTLPAMRSLLETQGSDTFDLVGKWGVYSPDGQVLNGGSETSAAMWCLDAKKMLPNTLKPARTARGAVVLDVPKGAGFISFEDPYFTGAMLEWAYGK